MQFEDFKETSVQPKATRPSAFVDFKSGDPVVGVVMGKPITTTCDFVGGRYVFSPTGKMRFKVNIIVEENGALVSKILEGPYGLYSQLKALQDSGYQLPVTKIKITRTKTAQATTYTVLPMPNGIVTETELANYEAVPLKELKWTWQS